MTANLKTLLFLFSILFNVAFIGAYAAYHFPSSHSRGPGGGFGKPVFLELDLTAEQVARLKAERDDFHVSLQGLHMEIKGKQAELIDLLAVASPDHQLISGRQHEIRILQAAVQDRVIVHLLQQGEVLNPEQRARFFGLIRERSENKESSCAPWMSR